MRRSVRRVGLVLAAGALAGALVADLHGQLHARLLLWICAAVLAGPAALHALLYGLSATSTRRALPGPTIAVEARAARGGLPPAPARRQLTS